MNLIASLPPAIPTPAVMAAFLLWLIYGGVRTTRSQRLKAKVFGQSRGKALAISSLFFIGSGAILFLGLAFPPPITSVVGMWLWVTAVGLVFTEGQIQAVAGLFAVAIRGNEKA